MEIMIGSRTIFNEKDVLEGISKLNPHEQVRLIAGILSQLRATIKKGESEMAERAEKEQGELAKEALKLLKEAL